MSSPAVIFDMDGVLVDSYRAHFNAWRRSAAARGVELTEAMFVGIFGRPNLETIPLIAKTPLSQYEVETWSADKEAFYRETLRDRVPIMDGAITLIEHLHDAGFLLGIGTSGPRENVEYLLAALPNYSSISAVISSEDITRGKPFPDVFLATAKLMGTDPRMCAVVEDSIAGIDAASRAKMTAIALTGSAPLCQLQAKADLVVESLKLLSSTQILNLIKTNSCRNSHFGTD